MNVTCELQNYGMGPKKKTCSACISVLIHHLWSKEVKVHLNCVPLTLHLIYGRTTDKIVALFIASVPLSLHVV